MFQPNIDAMTVGDAWLDSLAFVLRHGTDYYDGRVSLKEVLGLTVLIREPSPADAVIDRLGDPVVIARMFRKFAPDADLPDAPFTYGQKLYDHHGHDQIEWIIKRLARKPETKSATISLLVAGDENSHLPCLTTLDLKLRHGILHLQFFFRSQNIFGRQYANLLALSVLHRQIVDRCDVQLGTLAGLIASAHIYAFDLVDAELLVSQPTVRIRDRYYCEGPDAQ